MQKTFQPRLAFFIGILVAAVMPGATVYNESSQGDLSNSGLTPTLLPISLGSNTLLRRTKAHPASHLRLDLAPTPSGFKISTWACSTTASIWCLPRPLRQAPPRNRALIFSQSPV